MTLSGRLEEVVFLFTIVEMTNGDVLMSLSIHMFP